MKRIMFLIGVTFLFTAGLFLQDAFAKTTVPGRTRYKVNDYAGVIDRETKEYLEQFLSSIRQKTSDPVEVMVATFGEVEGWEYEDFALQYCERWRLTKKGRDNGVIIMAFPEVQKVFIGVGQNLKTILTEKKVNDIVQYEVIPEFNNGRYGEGVRKAAEIIVNILNEAEIPASPTNSIIKIIIIFSIPVMLGWGVVKISKS